MKTGSLQISAWSVTYDSYSFALTIRFGQLVTEVEVYADRKTWQQFGKELQTFPHSPTHSVTLRIDREAEIVLTAICYDEEGHAALRVLVADDRVQPGPYRLEFAIPVDIAGLNDLGNKLVAWPQNEYENLYWDAYKS
ncbi:hypothetical protein [Hymenobacter perfusus]|uniref:Uncharacterized protein n=1 Tax=Hymenobacter perfusus TaxID=1236770 RepID=A0A3R9MQ35_9BACT|nr:hypothetical protein [Hymenobacter perfusus]RSK45729.1 hypothetical protein EI293_00740 [Hymenobacter perfusus]